MDVPDGPYTAHKSHSRTAPVELTTLAHSDDASSAVSTSNSALGDNFHIPAHSQAASATHSNDQIIVVIDAPENNDAAAGPGTATSTATTNFRTRFANELTTPTTSKHHTTTDKRLTTLVRARPDRPVQNPSETLPAHRTGPFKAFLEAAQLTLTGRSSVPSNLAHLNATSSSVPRDYHAVLFSFVKEGNLRGVNNVVNNHILNLNYRDSSDCTFLHYAASNGHAEIARILCEHHANVDAPDDEMRSPLIRATRNGHIECVRALLDCNALVDKFDILGWTALMWASYKGELAIARLLIEKGANVNVKADQHMTCLSWAAGRGQTDVVRLLLQHNASPNTTDRYGSTALIWAARKGHAACCEALIDAGANADFVAMHARTPLLVAARCGSVECVRVLLRKATNINAVDKDGYTALGRAIKAQAFEIVELLVAAGAQTDAQDREGESILIHAVKTCSAQLVRLLLPKCNNINYQDSDGKTALFHAVDRNQLEITAALLDAKANAEIAAGANENNDTPLLRAVRNRSIELTELLLKKAKAKVTAVDSKGNTCLHIALRNRSRHITEVLLRNPKDNYLLYKPNRAGETPYSIDMSQQGSVLTQIFGFRNLNTIDSSDFLSGYDLYSSIIADVLTEPGLITPLTVGLYAKWGSGKSFLLERLEHEMRKFTYSAQLAEQLRDMDVHDVRFEPCYAAYCFALSCVAAYVVGVALFSALWCAVTLGAVFATLLIVLALVVHCARRGYVPAIQFGIRLRSRITSVNILFESLFCWPPSPGNADEDEDSSNGIHAPQRYAPKPPSAVRFIFSEKTPLNAVYSSGEQIAAHLLISLFKNVEREVGTFTTRLNCGLRARLPTDVPRRSRFKAVCYVPYYLICALALIALLADSVLVITLLRQYHVVTSGYHTSAAPSAMISPRDATSAPVPVNWQYVARTTERSYSDAAQNDSAAIEGILPVATLANVSTSASSAAPQAESTSGPNAGVQGVWINEESLVVAIIMLSSFLGVLLLTHSVRLFHILAAFLYPSQRRIQRALDKLSKSGESLTVGGDFHTLSQRESATADGRPLQFTHADGATRLLFLKTMQQEIRCLVQFVQLYDAFSAQTSRFILIVDGLDSVETVKLVSAVDLISALFCDSELAKSGHAAVRESRRFVVLLAIDPQLIIAGIDRSIAMAHHSQPYQADRTSLPTNICVTGFEYLRNLVQLPIYLQSPNLRLLPTTKSSSAARSRSRRESKRDSQTSLNLVGRQASLLSVRKPLTEAADACVLTSAGMTDRVATNAVQTSSHGGSQVLFSSHSQIPLAAASRPARAASELNVALVRNDYFSDINPKSMRRLLNITAVIGRILRAYNIEFSWPKLAVWTNITEQWPCRSAWIVWYFEQHSDTLEDSLTLRTVYERMVTLLPAASLCDVRMQRLFEVDRNPLKLERLINNEQLTRITVYDLRRFVPFGINLDPFFRKAIREHMNPSAAPAAPVSLPVPVSVPTPVDLALNVTQTGVRLRRRNPLDLITKVLSPDECSRLQTTVTSPLSHWRPSELATFVHLLAKPTLTVEQLTEMLVQNEIDGSIVVLMTELNDFNHLLKLPFAKWQRVKAALQSVRDRDGTAEWEAELESPFYESEKPTATSAPDVDSARLPSTVKARLSCSPSPSGQLPSTPSKEPHMRTVSFRGLNKSIDLSLAQQTAQRSPQATQSSAEALCSVQKRPSVSGNPELLDENLHELRLIQEVLDSRMADYGSQSKSDTIVDTTDRQLVSLSEAGRDEDYARPTRSPPDSSPDASDASDEDDKSSSAIRKRKRKDGSKKRERPKSGEPLSPQKERSHTSLFRKSVKTPDHRAQTTSTSATHGGVTSISDSTPLLNSSEKVGKFVVTKVESGSNRI